MRKKLGEILLASGVVTQADLDLALGDQTAGEPARVGDLLVSLGRITPTQLAKALSQQHAIPFIQLPPVLPEVLKAVPIEFQQQHRFVPFRVTGDAISIAMADPSISDVVDELRSSLNKKVNKYIAAGDEIDALHATLAPSVELPSIAPTIAPSVAPVSPTADELFGSLDAPAPAASGLGDDLFSGLDLPPSTADVPAPPAVQPVGSTDYELEQVPDAVLVPDARDEEEPEFFESKPVTPVPNVPPPPSIAPSPVPSFELSDELSEELPIEPAAQGLTSSSSGTFEVSTFELADAPPPSGASGSFEVSLSGEFGAQAPAAQPAPPPMESSSSVEVSFSESVAEAPVPAESSGNFEVSVAESSGDFGAPAAAAPQAAEVDDFFAQTAPSGAFSTSQEEAVSFEELPFDGSPEPQAAPPDSFLENPDAIAEELFSDAPAPAAPAPVSDALFSEAPAADTPATSEELFSDAPAADAFPFEQPPPPQPPPAPLPPPELESAPPIPQTADLPPPGGAPRESMPSWLGQGAPPAEPAAPPPTAAAGEGLVLTPGEWTGKLDDLPPSRLIVGAVKVLVQKGLVTEAEILEVLAKKS